MVGKAERERLLAEVAAVYDWIDIHDLQPGQEYVYWLESVDLYGQTRLYSPVQATTWQWRSVYLPLVGK